MWLKLPSYGSLLSTYDVCTVVEGSCLYRYCLCVAINNSMDRIKFTYSFCDKFYFTMVLPPVIAFADSVDIGHVFVVLIFTLSLCRLLLMELPYKIKLNVGDKVIQEQVKLPNLAEQIVW
jgi:hypothetical protein